MRLERINYLAEGVFGKLSDDLGLICYTLEHSFPEGGGFAAKLPPGKYTCRRGFHKLAGGDSLETFEVTEVPGHTGIIFHWGNYNKDSDGCILVGERRLPTMLVYSKRAFATLLYRTRGEDEFTLTVENK